MINTKRLTVRSICSFCIIGLIALGGPCIYAKGALCLSPTSSSKQLAQFETKLVQFYKQKKRTCLAVERKIQRWEKKHNVESYYKSGKSLPKRLKKEERRLSAQLDGCELHRLDMLIQWLPPVSGEAN